MNSRQIPIWKSVRGRAVPEISDSKQVRRVIACILRRHFQPNWYFVPDLGYYYIMFEQ